MIINLREFIDSLYRFSEVLFSEDLKPIFTPSEFVLFVVIIQSGHPTSDQH